TPGKRGVATAPSSASAPASHKAMRFWARSAFPTVPATLQLARYATSPPGFVLRPRTGQILVSSRIAEPVETVVRPEDLGNLELKGLRRPAALFNIVQNSGRAEARPNLTVVMRGPGV